MNHSSQLHVSFNSRFQARRMLRCRLNGLNETETTPTWDIENEFDPVASGWTKRMEKSIPHIEEDEMFLLHRIEWAVRSVVEKVGATRTWEWQERRE